MARTLVSILRHSRHSQPVDEDGPEADESEDRCVASGWHLRRGCTDGRGHGICPACARPVRMRSHRPLGDSAWVVEAHRAAA